MTTYKIENNRRFDSKEIYFTGKPSEEVRAAKPPSSADRRTPRTANEKNDYKKIGRVRAASGLDLRGRRRLAHPSRNKPPKR